MLFVFFFLSLFRRRANEETYTRAALPSARGLRHEARANQGKEFNHSGSVERMSKTLAWLIAQQYISLEQVSLFSFTDSAQQQLNLEGPKKEREKNIPREGSG